MKITVLVENTMGTSSRALRPEWGLSLLVESEGRQILFDTGASSLFAKNAAILGADLRDISAVVVSHHHSDHGGGLRRFFEVNTDAKVYLAPKPDGVCVFCPLPFVEKGVGLDQAVLTEMADRFVEVKDKLEVIQGVHLFTRIPKDYPIPSGNRYLYLRQHGKRVHDPFDHELVMVIQDVDGLTVFTGCSHSGVLNMVAKAADEFPGVRIKAVVGGMHLVGLPPFNGLATTKGDVERLAEQLLEKGVGKVYTGHCTGSKAYSIISGVMRDRLEPLTTGKCFEL